MRALHVAFVFASHVLSLALAVYTTQRSGVPVEILLYAFLIDYALRLAAIHTLHAGLGSPTPSLIAALAPFISRRPAPGQTSQPVRDGENGPPAQIGKYFFALAVLAFFAFALMNVNADKQIDLTPAAAARDMVWALAIGALYWINSLLTRTMVINPDDSLVKNLGYNTKEVVILSFAVLTGGAVVAVRQGMDMGPSAWTVMGPLLLFRFLYDLSASLAAIPDYSAASGDSSMRASRSHGPS